ncbi:acyl-CoA dehydrogenase [Candidatus Bathyarchaeota archaeon]|nr:MAG: acyl-CoA dehydrogenase [Candidatus Bathyarchaeota archaeon]
MDFELTEVQKDIQKAAKEFAQQEFSVELARKFEQEEEYPFELWRKACKLGFIGVHFPEEYGGQGLGIFENALVVEEFCKVDSTLGTALILSDFASEIILRFGSKEQKEEYLPKICKGEAISAGAFTEPEHGSDITFMSTKASKEGDYWIINGTKTLITNAPIASFFIVLCQTNPEAKPPYRGQSLFIVDKDTNGVDVTKIGGKMGIRPSLTGEISFSNVRIPKEKLVGQENRGFYHTLEFFDESRIEIAAQALGIAEGALERAVNYAKQREQFGQKIAEFQVIQHKIADMAIKIETAKLLVYKAAWNFDQGRIDPCLTSMAKAYAGRVAVEVADEAVQIFGGYGYIGEYDVERIYRDAKITEIYEGTREIQKNTIARAIIGKL